MPSSRGAPTGARGGGGRRSGARRTPRSGARRGRRRAAATRHRAVAALRRRRAARLAGAVWRPAPSSCCPTALPLAARAAMEDALHAWHRAAVRRLLRVNAHVVIAARALPAARSSLCAVAHARRPPLRDGLCGAARAHGARNERLYRWRSPPRVPARRGSLRAARRHAPYPAAPAAERARALAAAACRPRCSNSSPRCTRRRARAATACARAWRAPAAAARRRPVVARLAAAAHRALGAWRRLAFLHRPRLALRGVCSRPPSARAGRGPRARRGRLRHAAAKDAADGLPRHRPAVPRHWRAAADGRGTRAPSMVRAHARAAPRWGAWQWRVASGGLGLRPSGGGAAAHATGGAPRAAPLAHVAAQVAGGTRACVARRVPPQPDGHPHGARLLAAVAARAPLGADRGGPRGGRTRDETPPVPRVARVAAAARSAAHVDGGRRRTRRVARLRRAVLARGCAHMTPPSPACSARGHASARSS